MCELCNGDGGLAAHLSLAGAGTYRAEDGGQPTPKQSLLASTEPTLPEVLWPLGPT